MSPYTPYYTGGFVDREDGSTPLTAAALDHIDDGIADINSLVRIATSAQKAALTPQTGQVLFDTTLSKLQAYNGSAWQNVASQGRVLNVYFQQTPADRYDLAADDWVLIPGLSVTLQRQTHNSSFFLIGSILNTATYVTSFTFFRDGVNLFSHANTNQTGALVTQFWGQDNANEYLWSTQFMWMDTPPGETTVTYDVRGTSSWAGGTRTLRINDRLSGGTSSDMRGRSSFIVMEIAA